MIHAVRTALVFAFAAAAASPKAGTPAQEFPAADWFERDVAEGVVWRYYQFPDLFNSEQSISILEVDLDNPEVEIEFPYLASTRARPSTFIPGQFPDAAGGINGTFFDTSAGGGGSITYLRVDGATITQQNGGIGSTTWIHSGAVVRTNTGEIDVQARPGNNNWDSAGHMDALANGPVLLENGVADQQLFQQAGAFCTGRNPRTVAGITADNRLLFVTIDGRTEFAAGMTCDEMVQTMTALGATDAVNLDGGGSTTLWIAGEGVVNFPSDNGRYDNAGERSSSNGVAVVSPLNTSTLARDAELVNIAFNPVMNEGNTQQVIITYTNTGTETWTPANTRLITSRPPGRASTFAADGWISDSEPAALAQGTVPPGSTGTFTFGMEAPLLDAPDQFTEFFMLTDAGGDRFGPPDNFARMQITVENVGQGGVPDPIIVEAAPDGQNNFWYSEEGGFADTGATLTVVGTTGTGSRYGSTFRSVAGTKRGLFEPTIPQAGTWEISVAWPAGGLRRNPIQYTVSHETDNTPQETTILLDQTANDNEWISLGEYFLPAGTTSVVVSNESIDLSGNMYSGAVRWVFKAPAVTDGWILY